MIWEVINDLMSFSTKIFFCIVVPILVWIGADVVARYVFGDSSGLMYPVKLVIVEIGTYFQWTQATADIISGIIRGSQLCLYVVICGVLWMTYDSWMKRWGLDWLK